jgi:uncharacterized protein
MMTMFTLAVFAKLPILGQVKTRIAAETSDEFAFNLYEHLLTKCLLNAELAAQSFLHSTGLEAQVHWHYAGNLNECAAESTVIRRYVDLNFSMVKQLGVPDLGARMAACLNAYRNPVILFGSDIPSLDCPKLIDALQATVRSPTQYIFNPTVDGGYCLVGRGRPHLRESEIFAEMTWSTSQVMEQSRSKLKALNIDWQELEAVRDIDTVADALAYLTL